MLSIFECILKLKICSSVESSRSQKKFVTSKANALLFSSFDKPFWLYKYNLILSPPIPLFTNWTRVFQCLGYSEDETIIISGCISSMLSSAFINHL